MAARKATGAPAPSPAKQTPLDRYVSVLEVVAAEPGLGLGDIADRCGLPPATTHRLIRSLVACRLLETIGSRRKAYALGMRLTTLLASGSDERWVQGPAQRRLHWVADRVGETCFLAKLAHRRVYSIARAMPPTGVNGFVVPGLSQPLHAAACAKAILAHQTPAFVDAVIAAGLPKLCSETKTDPAALRRELAQVRLQGYATCWNENEPGIAAVACPIVVEGMDVLYSLGVTGLQSNIPKARFPELAAVLASAARDLAGAVGRSARATAEPPA